MVKNTVDVILFEWVSTPSRDSVPTCLLANFLELNGAKVEVVSIFNGYWQIMKKQPKAVYFADLNGSHFGFTLAKYCKQKGIAVFSGNAEGNIRDTGIEEFVWGHNSKKMLVADRIYYWSEEKLSTVLKQFPQLSRVGRACGSPMVDAHVIESQEIEGSISENKQKVTVGLGCWDFGIVDDRDSRYEYFKNYFSERSLARFVEERKNF